MEPFARLAAALNESGVRFVTIGVAGANLWARSGHTIFATEDYDLFLPPDPANALRAWQAAGKVGLTLAGGQVVGSGSRPSTPEDDETVETLQPGSRPRRVRRLSFWL